MADNSFVSPETDYGMEVPLGEVERELKRYFASDTAVTRASLMNFAVYREDPNSLQENTSVIREVTREHACRALLIALDPREDELKIRSWVTAHCNLSQAGGKSVCSEQITFQISGNSPYLLPNTVLSRLDSDLQLVFWWQGPFSDRFEPTLYSRIDRLIFDSGEWKNPLIEFERLEAAYYEKTSHFVVMDLTWTRVLQLRLALAACFDEAGSLAELPRANRLELSHGRNHAVACRMFVCWMAHQAGWKWVSSTADRQSCVFESKEGVQIDVLFRQDGGECPVSHLKLTSPEASWTVQREGQSSYWRSVAEVRGQRIEHMTPCTIEQRSQLIIERLRRGCNNRLYFSLLQVVKHLI